MQLNIEYELFRWITAQEIVDRYLDLDQLTEEQQYILTYFAERL
jgi:hypothetical protein